MNKEQKTEEIKKFWDERAQKFGEAWQATLGEKYLRLLEIKTMIKLIKTHNPSTILDVGCGNGYSTKIFANKFPAVSFTGVDYSESMIRAANSTSLRNCKFLSGDVTELTSLPEGKFDLIITQRCIQNLPDYEVQHKAIKNLLEKKTARGILLLMECSKDGVDQLNRVRQRLRLKPVEGIEPWHNTFFRDANLIKDFNARVVFFSSTYMFVAKILNYRLAALGYLLPQLGSFGYDRLYIIR